MTAAARIKTALAEQWQRKAAPVVALYLPFPISANRLWRPVRGRMIATERYRTWKQAAGAEINRQRPGRIKGAFSCRIVLERKEGRGRIDADNGIKACLDILQAYGVIENDRLANEVNVSWSENMTGAYVVLTAVAAQQKRVAA